MPEKKLRKDVVIVTMWVSEESMEGEKKGGEEGSMGFLGADQMLAILQLLPVPSVLSFGMTCKRHRELADSDELWAAICRREWGSRAVEAWPPGRLKAGWKRLYRQILALSAASWTRIGPKEAVPPARASHALNMVAGQLVLFGGGCSGGRDLSDTWVATMPEESAEFVWHLAACRSPSGRFGHSSCVVGDSLVIFGGINDKATRHNDTWVFRLGGAEGKWSWQRVETVSAPPARGAHAGCYAGDGKMVVFGGIGSDGVRLGDTWMLDLVGGTGDGVLEWRQVVTPVSPPPRSGHTLTWIGGKRMVLFGGRGVRFQVMNDVWMLDMEEEWPRWIELCPSIAYNDWPSPRAGHSASLIFGGRLLVFGGEDASRRRKGDVWVLDPAVQPQSRAADCGQARASDSGAAAAGGNGSSNSKFARRFWKKIKQWGPAPCHRSFHAACALDSGHAVLIFGGMVDGELVPQLAGGLGFDSELYLLQLLP